MGNFPLQICTTWVLDVISVMRKVNAHEIIMPDLPEPWIEDTLLCR